MPLPKPEPLCRYRYDPLDRLAGCLPLGQADTRCFYRLNRLTTESQGPVGTSWLQTEDLLLAQWRHEAKSSESLLVATDRQGSVIHAIETDRQPSFVYTPYGVRQPAQAPLHLPGFNGQRRDPVTGHYLLGNGYRAFNPVLMRFNSPDSLSPFGEGGLNAYAYCAGNPITKVDPSGHIGRLWTLIKQNLSRFKKVAPPLSPQGFGVFRGMPHIVENIAEYLPGKSLEAWALVSKETKALVYTASTHNYTKNIPKLMHSYDEAIRAVKGTTVGILPVYAKPIAELHQLYQKTMTSLHVRFTAIRSGPVAAPPRSLTERRGAIFHPRD